MDRATTTTLGPALRPVPSLSIDYYGFDTSRPPFDDVRVRQAFAAAVDWRRIVALGSPARPRPATRWSRPASRGGATATSLPGPRPGRGAGAAGRGGLSRAAAGFPEITLLTAGRGYDEAIVAELKRELGITIGLETMDFDPTSSGSTSDPPQHLVARWVADYPGRNDFLGMLLGSGAVEQLRPLELAPSSTRRSPTPARPPTRPAVRAAYDTRGGDRPARGAGGPASATARAGRWRATGSSGPAENGLGIPRLAGLAWAAMTPRRGDRARRRSPRPGPRVARSRRCSSASRRPARRRPRVRDADGELRFGTGVDFAQPVTLDGPPSGSSC